MRLVRRHWPLTSRGAGAVVLGGACFVLAHETGLAVLLYFGVLLLVAVLISVAALHLAPHGSSLTRAVDPGTAAVGDTVTVTVRVSLRAVLPTSPGAWEDVLPAGMDGDASGEFPATRSALARTRSVREPISLSYRVTARMRGVHALGPFSITTTDPFGLARRRTALGEPTPVTVAPPVVPLPPVPGAGGEAGGTRRSTATLAGQGSEDLIARPYAPGDSMRRVHWRATARFDRIMVRQEEQEARPAATVVLDLAARRWSRDAALRTGADPHFETSVSAVLSIAARLARDGFSVQVRDAHGALIGVPLEGRDAGEVLVLARELATVTARDEHAPVPIGAWLPESSGPLVMVTGLWTVEDADALRSLAQHSSLRLLLAASPADEALVRMAEIGWRAVPAPAGVDLARAWETLVSREASRVAR